MKAAEPMAAMATGWLKKCFDFAAAVAADYCFVWTVGPLTRSWPPVFE